MQNQFWLSHLPQPHGEEKEGQGHKSQYDSHILSLIPFKVVSFHPYACFCLLPLCKYTHTLRKKTRERSKNTDLFVLMRSTKPPEIFTMRNLTLCLLALCTAFVVHAQPSKNIICYGSKPPNRRMGMRINKPIPANPIRWRMQGWDLEIIDDSTFIITRTFSPLTFYCQDGWSPVSDINDIRLQYAISLKSADSVIVHTISSMVLNRAGGITASAITRTPQEPIWVPLDTQTRFHRGHSRKRNEAWFQCIIDDLQSKLLE